MGPLFLVPLPTPSYLTCKICNRCGVKLDARDCVCGAHALLLLHEHPSKHTPSCFLRDWLGLGPTRSGAHAYWPLNTFTRGAEINPGGASQYFQMRSLNYWFYQ